MVFRCSDGTGMDKAGGAEKAYSARIGRMNAEESW